MTKTEIINFLESDLDTALYYKTLAKQEGLPSLEWWKGYGTAVQNCLLAIRGS